MKLRRLAYGLSTAVLSVSSLFVLISPAAHAANVTWNGNGGDGKFNTAANWSGNTLSTTGDTINFDTTGLAANTILTNDLVGAPQLAGIVQSGTNVGHYSFTITGSDLQLGGSINGGTDSLLVIDSNINIASSTIIAGQVKVNSGKTVTLSADLTINGNAQIDGTLAGSGNVAVANNGTLGLNSANTWAQNLTIQAGARVVTVPGGLGQSANVITVNSGGELDLCGFKGASIPNPMTIGGSGLSSAGVINSYGSCGSGGLGITGPVADANANIAGDVILSSDVKLYSTGLLKFNGNSITGTHTLTIFDGIAGTLELAASTNSSSTLNGVYKSAEKTTTVSSDNPSGSFIVEYNNILVVNAKFGDVDVYAGTLKGSGTVGVLSLHGGNVAPGNSPGVLNTGNLVFTGGNLLEEIGGTGSGEFDQLNVTGTVDLGTATALNASQWNGFTPKVGDKFIIINNDASDAVIGTFQGLAEGATVTAGSSTYTISYKGGDGNDVVLTASGMVAKAPNTGFAMLNNNPLLTLVITSIAVAGISLAARKQLLQNKK